MKVATVVVGDLLTNCYVVSINQKAIIIDPGAEPEKIINYIEEHKLKPVGYLITHDHFDHVEGLPEMLTKYKIKKMNSDNVFDFNIINTPGHTKDGVCFYFAKEKVMFTGDTLFKETVGRMDLEGGNHREMFKSLALLKAMDDDIIIYPGHGESSTLEYEKVYNVWLK